MINWSKIKKLDETLPSVLVGEFKIDGYRGLREITIKIWENPNTSSPYIGECEYGFWGPKQANAYWSMHPQKTIEDAYNDALKGITSFDSEEYSNEYVFFVKHINDATIYIDGDGELVTLDEIKKRHENYNK